MVDVGSKTSAGSPWDEPVPEVQKPKKAMPTVVGDLDFSNDENSKPQPAPAATPLSVPKDIEEKVGNKVPASEILKTDATSAPIEKKAEEVPAVKNEKPPVPENKSQNANTENAGSHWVGAYQRASADIQAPKPNQNLEMKADQVVPVDIKPVEKSPQAVGDNQPATIPIKEEMKKPVENISSVPIVPEVKKPAGNIIPPATSTPPVAGSHLFQPVPISSPKPSQSPQPQTKPNIPATKMPIAGKRKSKIGLFVFGGIIAVILIFAVGVFLTEEGILSIGLEKVYGAVRLETLWRGLPANPENALAMSLSKMKDDKNFKVSGDATLTISGGSNSEILGPIVSSLISASSTDDSTVTGVKSINFAINSTVSNDISGADLTIKSSKNQKSTVNLVYANKKMYLKSTSDIVYNKNASDGFTTFDFSKMPNKDLLGNLEPANFTSSNFSVTGSRKGSETIDGIKCFYYTGQINLGDSLSSFGIKNTTTESVDAEYWLGVKDHRMHKLVLKIIPATNSVVSRIDATLSFSDFGAGAGSYSIPVNSTPYPGFSASATTTPNSSATKTSDETRKSDLATIAAALSKYYIAKSSYPSSSGNEKISATSGVLYSALVPTYLSALPLDPQTPSYYYGYESNGTSYALSAVLDDKTDTDGRMVGNKNIYFLRSVQ